MSPFCSQCGKENTGSNTVCWHCGAAMPKDGPESLLGKVVFDSYALTEIVGQGGMAVVYRGRNKITDQQVAVKVLPPELAAYAEVKTRFVDEARTLAKLEHPNIVHLINFAEDLGRLCLVMQYAEGATLEDLIDTAGRVVPREAVRITLQVLGALHHAHRHEVVHRDIKPSNIIVRPDGSVKVTDFGIAKITRSTKLTQDGQTMGTVRYMSPEQVQGTDIDPRSDIYSLGVTLYEAVVGDTPFDGDTHFSIMNQHIKTAPPPPIESGAPISQPLQEVILRALAKKKADRFSSAEEMAEALRACPEAGAVRAEKKERRPTQTKTKVEKTPTATAAASSKKRLWLVALVGGIAVLAGTVVFFVFGPVGSRSDAASGRKPSAARQRATQRDQARSRSGSRSANNEALRRWREEKHPKLKAVAQKVQWAARMEHEHKPHLRILSEVALDTAEIARVYQRGLKLYPAMLKAERIAEPVLVRPLVMVFLKAATFNDASIWGGQAGADVLYYPLPVATLFVTAQKNPVSSSLLYGIASHLCPARLASSDCHRLAGRFESYYKARAEK